MVDTLIIGAGISGLLAATQLQTAGQSVLVLDKGRGVGGRMASRRIPVEGNTQPDHGSARADHVSARADHVSAKADHGAQFFTVRDPQFKRWVEQWIEAGAIEEWCQGFSGHDGHPRYRGTGGMTAVAKHLANSLKIRTQTKAISIKQKDGAWQISTAANEDFYSQNLILTPPVPQSLAMLHVDLPQAGHKALEAIQYHPCFAVMVVLSKPSYIPSPGGIQVRGPVIDWIGDNHQKGISAAITITIHASPEYTQQHLNDDRLEVGQHLIQAAHTAGYFDQKDVANFQVHRWLYAQPIDCYPERCFKSAVNGLPIVFAGDAFKHARVEGAALSGLAAAESLLYNKQP